MLVNFTKMHGLGNDFVVIDCISQINRLETQSIQRLCDRQLGIGCDQVILIDPPWYDDADFAYRIFNPDGREVEQCGNGARCAARYVYESGLCGFDELTADCAGGRMHFKVESSNDVSVAMPANLDPSIHLMECLLDGQLVQVYCLNVGNPHAVLLTDNLDAGQKYSPQLSQHALFPHGVNVGVLEIKDAHSANLRVYERGAGHTLACGSGAVAAFLVGRHLGHFDQRAQLNFSLGSIEVSQALNGPLLTRGPTRKVFTGRFKV